MKIYFWQNIISPHQVDFLKALSHYYNIVLIVQEVQDADRKKDGWEIPDYNFLEIIIAPPLNTLNIFFSNKEDIHVFSGISAYKTVFAGLKCAVLHKAKIGLLSEPISFEGLVGFLKFLRGRYQYKVYGKHIDFIAATGDLGIQTYLKSGFSEKKLFHWEYFVNQHYTTILPKKNRITFVGNLNDNKQINLLVKVFFEGNHNYQGFDIIGSGPLENEIKNMVQHRSDVKLYGRLENKKTVSIIAENQLLVLPSKEDGWGVVVNEALSVGTPVITSDKVGARILVRNSNRGDVFTSNNFNQLQELIIKWSNKNYDQEDYSEIQEWAREKLSPTVAAQYFSEIISYTFNRTPGQQKPVAPWLK